MFRGGVARRFKLIARRFKWRDRDGGQRPPLNAAMFLGFSWGAWRPWRLVFHFPATGFDRELAAFARFTNSRIY